MNEPNMKTIEDIKTELLSIIELSDKATPAPWEDDGCGHMWHPYPYPEPVNGYEGEHITLGRFSEQDFTFIAASRNLTPKMAKVLLAVIERSEVAVSRLDSHLARYYLKTICREWEVQP